MHVLYNYLYFIGFFINLWYATVTAFKTSVPVLYILWYVHKNSNMLKCWILICWAVCDMMMFYDSDYHITLDMILYYLFMFEKIEAATRRSKSICRFHLQNLLRFMEYKLPLLTIYLTINQINQSNISNLF